MSLAGVRSNRGDGYQTLVAFGWALKIISDNTYQWLEIDSTSLDAVGRPIAVDDVVIGLANGYLIGCQCKKNQPHFESWKIKELGDELKKAGQFLRDNTNARVIFYTRGNFGAIAKLKDHGIAQPTQQAYIASLTKEHQSNNLELEAYLSGIDSVEFLQRCEFEQTVEFSALESGLMERLSYAVSNANIAFNALWCALDKLGLRGTNNDSTAAIKHRLTRDDLLKIIQEAGANFAIPKSAQELRLIFRDVSVVGRSWCRKVGNTQLHAVVVDELVMHIQARAKCILLIGAAGGGKSCALLELQENLEQVQNVVPIYIQAREYASCFTPEAREAQGLPKDFIGLVGRMADYKHTIILIDSLDVLSLAKDYSILSYFLAQIDRLLVIPNITAVVACREFDYKYDKRIAERTWEHIVSCKPLDWQSVVLPLIHTWGIDDSLIDSNTQTLIQNPRELAMFAEIAKNMGGFSILTSQALSHKYLDVIVKNNPSLGDSALLALEQISKKMLQTRRLYVELNRLDISQALIVTLISTGVLLQNQSNHIEFGHQTLVDVLVIKDAERNALSVKSFIESLPAVPFVRPIVRAYVQYLLGGERASFRKQVRAVFASPLIAFHIKRLIAETMAEFTPTNDDWPLIQYLHQHHLGVFNAIYAKALSIEWHYFWLSFLVPYVVQTRNSQALTAHVNKISIWKKQASNDVLAFWECVLIYDWIDNEQIANSICYELKTLHIDVNTKIEPLLIKLMTFSLGDYTCFGEVLSQGVMCGAVNIQILWSYIIKDVEDADILVYQLDKKLRCQPHEFQDKNTLKKLMEIYEELLDLALTDIENWSLKRYLKYYGDRQWYEGFLSETSYRLQHTQNDYHNISEKNFLLDAVEAAIQIHAQNDSSWWLKNKNRLANSHEGALRYFTIKALTDNSEINIETTRVILLDKTMYESGFLFEMGNLLNRAFVFLEDETQERIMGLIGQLWADSVTQENKENILQKRAELFVAIPSHLRTERAQHQLNTVIQKYGVLERQPEITQWGGGVTAPFSFEWFCEASDVAVIKMLTHYQDDDERDAWKYRSLIGGKNEVGSQLREAASRHPIRFMYLLKQYWLDIEEFFADQILNGVANYLSYNYGNLQKPQNWRMIGKAFRVNDLVELILDEIERNSAHWKHNSAAAKALLACSYVITDENNASRLVFLAIGFAGVNERSDMVGNGEDLLTNGINMKRGNVAESLIILATNLGKNKIVFPELLAPTLKRFAADDSLAVRAVILRRLSYFQYLQPELGWELFDIITLKSNDELWEIAEPCLYYSYRNDFTRISKILSDIYKSSTAKALQTWGRISALAVLNNKIDAQYFINQLQYKNSMDAWIGAITVWSNDKNIESHQQFCFDSIFVALQNQNDAIVISAAKAIAEIFRKNESIVYVPINIVNFFFDVLEKSKDNNQCGLYDFDSWLANLAKNYPQNALILALRFIKFVQKTNFHFYTHDNAIFQLLNRLFREAEEIEETDNGIMLQQVIALQDACLAININGFESWLKEAERL